jgi:hypothetical protein
MADEQKVEELQDQDEACTREGEGGVPIVLDPPPPPPQ